MRVTWEIFAEGSSSQEEFNVPEDGMPSKFTMGVNWKGQHFDFSKIPEFTEVDKTALHGKKLEIKSKEIPNSIPKEEKQFYYLEEK